MKVNNLNSEDFEIQKGLSIEDILTKKKTFSQNLDKFVKEEPEEDLNKLSDFESLVLRLINVYDEPTSIEQIFEKYTQHFIKNYESAITKLLEEGLIYEPRPNEYLQMS